MRAASLALLLLALPLPAAETWKSLGPPGGAFDIVAVNGSHLAVADRGRIWTSDDGAKTWAPLHRRADDIILGMAIDARGRLWVADETALYLRRDDQVVKVLDNGANSVDVAGDMVYAGGEGELFASDDGGAHWTRSRVAKGLYFGIAVDRRDPRVAYALGERAYRTNDGGKSWKALAPIVGTHLAVDGDHVYAATDSGLFHSDNRGDDFEAALPGKITSLAVDSKSARIYASGRDTAGVVVSNDRGKSWKRVAALPADEAYSLTVSGGRVFAAMKRRLHESDDGGATWHFVDAGIVGTSIWSVALPPSTRSVYAIVFGDLLRGDGGTWTPVLQRAGDTVSSVVADPGELRRLLATVWNERAQSTTLVASTDAGATWKPVGAIPSSVGKLVVDSRQPKTMYLFEDMFDGRLFASRDGGERWAALPPHGVTALAVDPHDSDRIFAGTNRGLVRSNDRGATWSRVVLPLGCPEDDADFHGVEALVADASRLGTALYVAVKACDGVRLFHTANGGDTWRRLTVPNAERITAIAVDGKGTRLFVGTNDGVFRSTDDGGAWTALRSGFDPEGRLVNVLELRGNVLYAGTASAGVLALE